MLQYNLLYHTYFLGMIIPHMFLELLMNYFLLKLLTLEPHGLTAYWYCHAILEIHRYSGSGTNLDTSTIQYIACLLYTSPSPRDGLLSRMPSSA